MNVIRRILCFPAILVNLIVGSGLLFCAYSPFISPVTHPYWACAGLFLPVFMVANLVCMIYWLFLHRYWAVLPLVFFVLCWKPIRTYMPFNREHKILKTGGNTIDVLTYNLMYLYTTEQANGTTVYPALEFIRERNADMVFVQEFPMQNKKALKALDIYPYHVMKKSLACFSRYPILSHRLLDYNSVYNGSMMVEIKVGEDTMLVINNHLESNKLDSSDKEAYNHIISAPDKDNVKKDGKMLLGKLAEAVSLRAPQADSVAMNIRRYRRKLTLVCGDFNDSPISYAHRIIGGGLKDAFVDAGNGPGFTYNRSKMYFRIDHIFVSEYLRVIDCEVENKIKASDHYPVWCRLQILPTVKHKKS